MADRELSLRFTREQLTAQGLGGDVARAWFFGAGATYTLTADTGTFTLIGYPANLLRQYRLTAETGVFTLTGYDADLIYTPAVAAGAEDWQARMRRRRHR